MDRETKIRGAIILTAAVITAAALLGLYSSQPIQLYQVVVQPTAAPAEASLPSRETAPIQEDGSTASESPAFSSPSSGEELVEPDPEGPQEVLVEKSVNINTATLEELDKLPGVGPVIAQRIIDYREQNNGFYDVQELMDVSGIGEKTFAKLEPYSTTD